jgi:hypothetical protein
MNWLRKLTARKAFPAYPANRGKIVYFENRRSMHIPV